jgi:hypothetical protein
LARYRAAVSEALRRGGAIDLEAIVASQAPAAPPQTGLPAADAGHGDHADHPDNADHARTSLPTAAASPPSSEPAKPAAAEQPHQRPAEPSPWMAPDTDAANDPGVPQGERIPLINAGLVLAAPYLQRLFNMLGLTEGGRFIDTEAAERGVHLLQYLACAEAAAPEYQLVLNKLLCGLALDAPVPAGIDIGEQERDTISGLLKAMVSAWGALGNTSADGLRQSFLMREGELWLEDESWQLQVAPGPFDMLMDRLPWSFSIIKFPWMAMPLHVSWH